jgi:hypothetical protein
LLQGLRLAFVMVRVDSEQHREGRLTSIRRGRLFLYMQNVQYIQKKVNLHTEFNRCGGVSRTMRWADVAVEKDVIRKVSQNLDWPWRPVCHFKNLCIFINNANYFRDVNDDASPQKRALLFRNPRLHALFGAFGILRCGLCLLSTVNNNLIKP